MNRSEIMIGSTMHLIDIQPSVQHSWRHAKAMLQAAVTEPQVCCALNNIEMVHLTLKGAYMPSIAIAAAQTSLLQLFKRSMLAGLLIAAD